MDTAKSGTAAAIRWWPEAVFPRAEAAHSHPHTGAPAPRAPHRQADALMRQVDWAATPVGAPGGWPAGLRAAVDMVMGSRFPMVVMWGPQLTLFYNDAYIPILGERHPGAMGQPAHECWAEIWHQTGPMLRRVMETGEPIVNKIEHEVMTNGRQSWSLTSKLPLREQHRKRRDR